VWPPDDCGCGQRAREAADGGLFSARRDFDGETYAPPLDGRRLGAQLQAVYNEMMDGGWHTLAAVAVATGASEASVSARLRDLRKARFGSFTVVRRRVAGGLHEYRLEHEDEDRD
jgi:hypothetical protein